MDRDSDEHPVIVSIGEHRRSRQAARPGVIVWLTDHAPDEDEIARAAAMRRHPAGSSTRRLRAVS